MRLFSLFRHWLQTYRALKPQNDSATYAFFAGITAGPLLAIVPHALPGKKKSAPGKKTPAGRSWSNQLSIKRLVFTQCDQNTAQKAASDRSAEIDRRSGGI
jgi:hypothetical protein